MALEPITPDDYHHRRHILDRRLNTLDANAAGCLHMARSFNDEARQVAAELRDLVHAYYHTSDLA